MRVAVVGAGIMGLSVAWALARRDVEVSLFDRDSIPNPRSASHDAHRLIRYPYGALTGYRALIPDAFDAWEELWSDLGARYFVPTGTLVFGRPDSPWLRASVQDMAESGRPMTGISHGDARALAPGLRLEDSELAWFTESGGVLLADRIVAALSTWLETHGAVMHPSSEVVSVRSGSAAIGDSGPTIRLSSSEVHTFDRVIVCTGSWAPPVSEGPSFRPSRQVVRYVSVPPESPWRPAPMVLGLGHRDGFYLVPPVAGTELKIGDHRFSLRGHPDDDREPGSRECSELDAILRSRIPALSREPSRYKVCYYAVTADERFEMTADGPVWSLGGFSGHGFKFGALVGRDVARAVTGAISVTRLRSRLAGHVDVIE